MAELRVEPQTLPTQAATVPPQSSDTAVSQDPKALRAQEKAKQKAQRQENRRNPWNHSVYMLGGGGVGKFNRKVNDDARSNSLAVWGLGYHYSILLNDKTGLKLNLGAKVMGGTVGQKAVINDIDSGKDLGFWWVGGLPTLGVSLPLLPSRQSIVALDLGFGVGAAAIFTKSDGFIGKYEYPPFKRPATMINADAGLSFFRGAFALKFDLTFHKWNYLRVDGDTVPGKGVLLAGVGVLNLESIGSQIRCRVKPEDKICKENKPKKSIPPPPAVPIDFNVKTCNAKLELKLAISLDLKELGEDEVAIGNGLNPKIAQVLADRKIESSQDPEAPQLIMKIRPLPGEEVNFEISALIKFRGEIIKDTSLTTEVREAIGKDIINGAESLIRTVTFRFANYVNENKCE